MFIFQAFFNNKIINNKNFTKNNKYYLRKYFLDGTNILSEKYL